jgi:Helix-loop-helix DNA-binding domain
MAPDFNFGRVMPESPTFVKEEQDDFRFSHSKFMANPQQFPNNNNQFTAGMDGNGIDPSNLMMNGNMINNNYGQNLSFGMGSGAIQDDDLDYLVAEEGGFNELGPNQANFFPNQPNNGVSMTQQPNVNVFSNTPEAPPISSPFRGNFNYQQYGVAMPNGFTRMKMERHPSDSRSPMTPKTPALTGLRIGTPDSMNQNMLNQQLHNQARVSANQWDGTPGSNQSWMDSPLPSPHGHHIQQPGIHEVLQGRGSVPTKLEGAHSASLPSLVSQEAKKKRRRESHNLVERRRRDNINERIQDLSRLVPSHRLEDEKVRKHLQANGPLSPQGVSPPGRGDPATSHLAPGSARRATAGTITTGLPQEEKEKGPNKGDILNGAVAWTRDLMWYSYSLIQQREQLKEYIQSLGGTWPHQPTDEEHRMVAELSHVVERNGVANFDYSRKEGTHLRVPGFTNYAGETLQPGDPAIKNEGSDTDLWFSNGGESGRNSLSIKEEDDFGMDMG